MFSDETKQSTCHVKDCDTSMDICGKKIPGKFPTNLKNHLQKVHPQIYSELIEKEEVEKEAKMKESASSLKVSHQLTMCESLKSGSYEV